MEMESYEHGVPSWVDLGTPDLEKATAFYGGLFGWDVKVGPPEAGGYAIAELRGRPVAGLGPQQNPGPPVWASYVNVDDADAVFELIKDNGGQAMMEPFDILDVGRAGYFVDPAGAVLAVWQPRLHKGAEIVNETGTLSWNELVSTDIEGVKPFYKAVFGWDAETHGDGPMAYTEWKLGGRSIGGGMAKPPMMPAAVPSHWAVYFAVDDTDAAVAKVTELGGSTIMPPMDIEPGRFAVVADPSGAMFNVIKMNAAAH